MLWPFYFDWPISNREFKHCCKNLTDALTFNCDMHSSPFECGDNDLVYHEVFDEYGLIHHNPEGTYTLLRYCPFCGEKKPPSLRGKWLKSLEKMGFDLFGDKLNPANNDNFSYTNGWREMGVPEIFLNASWRLGKKE
jgi:hypothetical protein